MPYSSKNNLPKTVQKVLPSHAQDIYRLAFNHAWEEYSSPADRKDNRSREATAHSVAWAAVKKKYKKGEENNWVEK